MAVPTSRADLSITPSGNSPQGSEPVFPNLDNYLRAAFAFDAQNYADIAALTAAVAALLPAGLIAMWSGATTAVPTGWTLCDGSNGTPDLRDRFVIGAGGARAVGATGGAVSAASDSQGAHTHSGSTGSTVLTTDQIPTHTHSLDARLLTEGVSGTGLGGTTPGESGAISTTGSAGGGQGHTHTVSSDGAHTHTVATLPPFYALCFIMKTA